MDGKKPKKNTGVQALLGPHSYYGTCSTGWVILFENDRKLAKAVSPARLAIQHKL